ncbi:MAG: PepSY domain-containing protein [Rhodobacteraceae bacterium]|nr:PepSY domain-containing protein [Paracoccaceae bacterium]
MRRLATTTAALLLLSGTAFAQASFDQVVKDLEQQGYTNIETVRATNQFQIRAQRGGEFRQLVYDPKTGKLLSDEVVPLQDRDQLRDMDGDGDGVPDRDRDQDRDRVDAPDGGSSGGSGASSGRGN